MQVDLQLRYLVKRLILAGRPCTRRAHGVPFPKLQRENSRILLRNNDEEIHKRSRIECRFARVNRIYHRHKIMRTR